MKKNNKKNKTLKRIGTVALVSCLVLSGSAWLTSRQTADGINKIKTGSIKIDFVEQGSKIVLTENDAIPMSGAYAFLNLTPYEFKIKNTGTIPFVYQLKAVLEDDNTFDITDKVKVTLGDYVNLQYDTNVHTFDSEGSAVFDTAEEAKAALAELKANNPGKEGYVMHQYRDVSAGVWKYKVARGFEKTEKGTFNSFEEADALVNTILASGDIDGTNKLVRTYNNEDGTYTVAVIDYTVAKTNIVDRTSWYSLTDLINGNIRTVLAPSQTEDFSLLVRFDESLVNSEIKDKKVSFHLEAEALQAEVADYYKSKTTGEIIDQMSYAYYWFENPGDLVPFYGDVYELQYGMGIGWSETPTVYVYTLNDGNTWKTFDELNIGDTVSMPWGDFTITAQTGTETATQVQVAK